jgi:hypothetical protein
VSRKLRFSLRTLFLVVLIIAIALAVTVPVCRWARLFLWARRDISELNEIVSLGMPIVDDIERFNKSHGWYPTNFEEGGITSPFTSIGYFAYARDMEAGDYGLFIYLGPTDGYLHWDLSRRCWTTKGRLPQDITWTEREARLMAAASRKSKVPSPEGSIDGVGRSVSAPRN